MCCYVNQLEDKREIMLKLTFEDKMERELTSELKNGKRYTRSPDSDQYESVGAQLQQELFSLQALGCSQCVRSNKLCALLQMMMLLLLLGIW